jgi:hypothetical protein
MWRIRPNAHERQSGTLIQILVLGLIQLMDESNSNDRELGSVFIGAD